MKVLLTLAFAFSAVLLGTAAHSQPGQDTFEGTIFLCDEPTWGGGGAVTTPTANTAVTYNLRYQGASVATGMGTTDGNGDFSFTNGVELICGEHEITLTAPSIPATWIAVWCGSGSTQPAQWVFIAGGDGECDSSWDSENGFMLLAPQ